MQNNRLIAISQTTGILFLMSLGTVLTKLALSDVDPFTFAWLSVAVGMVALSLYTFVIRKEEIPRSLTKEVWFYIICMGFFNFFVARITLTFSLDLLEATTNTYLVNFVGFLTMGMSIFILKESPSLFQLLGAIIALIGLRIFFVEVPPPSELWGIFLLSIGILGIALTNNLARKLALVTESQLSNNIISSYALLIGGSLLVIVGLIIDTPPQISGMANFATVLYAGVVMIAFCMTVWNYVLHTLRSYEASILGASTVIWTALLAIPILGETLSVNKILGIILMLAGLAIVQVRSGELRAMFGRG